MKVIRFSVFVSPKSVNTALDFPSSGKILFYNIDFMDKGREHLAAFDGVAGILASLVPYHHARWQAFAQTSQVPCRVVELTNKDEFPVMEVSPTNDSVYERITLFPEHAAAHLSPAEISRAIARVLDRCRPACICLSGYASPLTLGALAWGVSRAVPVVMMSESTAWDEPRHRWKEWIKSRVIRLCSGALVGGSPHADYMVQLGMPRERIFTGYDVVDNDYFKRGTTEVRSREGELRVVRGLPEKYFVACARFVPKKNLPRLLQAYARYRRLASSPEASGSVPWDLVILGDGEGRDALVGECSDLGLQGHVHLVGARPYDELPVYYGLASAFIHASTTEQWGLVVNEAMAGGLPVLVSNRCGCAPDLVQEGVNGYTFDPHSVEDLAQKMFLLATAPARLSTLAQASREIIAKWSPQTFAEGLSQAIAAARANPAPHATWMDKMLLWILIRR